MADTTLTDLAKELQEIADTLTQLSEAIVQAHSDLGNQLQQTADNVTQKPLMEDITTKQGG